MKMANFRLYLMKVNISSYIKDIWVTKMILEQGRLNGDNFLNCRKGAGYVKAIYTHLYSGIKTLVNPVKVK